MPALSAGLYTGESRPMARLKSWERQRDMTPCAHDSACACECFAHCCLYSPLPVCRYELAVRRQDSAGRRVLIRELRDKGMKRAEVATFLGISLRSVDRLSAEPLTARTLEVTYAGAMLTLGERFGYVLNKRTWPGGRTTMERKVI